MASQHETIKLYLYWGIFFDFPRYDGPPKQKFKMLSWLGDESSRSWRHPLDAEDHVTKVMSTTSMPWRTLSTVERASLRKWLHWKLVASACMKFRSCASRGQRGVTPGNRQTIARCWSTRSWLHSWNPTNEKCTKRASSLGSNRVY